MFVMRWFLKIALLVMLLSLAIAGVVHARENAGADIKRSAGNLEVPRGMILNGNVSLGAGELTVYGIVNGDVYGSLGQVNIHGSVNGDTGLNSGQLVVTGNVTGDVTLQLGEVIVDGVVGGNLETGLGSAVVRGSVGGSVSGRAGLLQINGTVRENVTASGRSKIIINGEVGGDVTLSRGLVEIGPRAVVNGRVFVEQGLVKLAAGAIVGSYEVVDQLTEAEVNRMLRSVEITTGDNSEVVEHLVFALQQLISGIRFIPEIGILEGWRLLPFYRFGLWHPVMVLLNMVALFALAALTRAFFPGQVRSAGFAIDRKTAAVVGWGLLALVLMFPLAILLVLTIIGIPLILVLILLLALAAVLGYTALAVLVGKKIFSAGSTRTVNPILEVGVGVVLLNLVTLIPLLGALFGLVIFIISVGAAAATRFGLAQLPGGAGGEANGA